MDDTQYNRLMKQLKSIDEKLSLLVKFSKLSTPSIKVTGEEKKILALCNQKYNIDDIMKITGKTRNNVQVTLTHLRSKGLITAEKIKGKLVYRRL